MRIRPVVRQQSDTTRHALEVLEYERVRETVAAYAASPLGKARAGELVPLTDLKTVRQHLRQTEEMRALIRHARVPLAGLRDVMQELDALAEQGRPGEPDFLYRVVDLLRVGLSVRELLLENLSALPELAAMASEIEDLPELRQEIPARIAHSNAYLDSQLVGLRHGRLYHLIRFRQS